MENLKLNEQDLELIFGGKKNKKQLRFRSYLRYFLFFALVFGASYFLVNFSAFTNILGFWYKTEIEVDNSSSQHYPDSIISLQSGDDVKTTKSNLPNVAENHLLIPKIASDAPVSWRVVNNETTIQNKLQDGLVHLAGTSLPGESGNVFITGHSSNYLWAKGSYKNVFSLLNKLVVGDLIYIKYQNTTYIYRTTEVKTIKPTDTSVLNQGSDNILTLMTCTPVGTSINRLIIRAAQILPDPSGNAAVPNSNTPNSLPAGIR